MRSRPIDRIDRCARPATLAALAACVLLGSTLAVASGAEPDEASVGPEGGARAGTSKTVPADQDVEGGPLVSGERFREVTPITPAELDAVHPGFRALARKIAAGEADKRDMRRFDWLMWRLEPYHGPVDLGAGRALAFEIHRDRDKTRRAIAAFEARRAERLASSGASEDEGLSSFASTASTASTSPTSAALGLPATGTWTPIGPTNIPGRTTDLDQPVGQPDTMYAATAAGGVWRTTDRGATWTSLTDFEDALSGGAVLVDPNDPNTVWFATGEGNFTGTSTGVFGTPMYPGIGVLKTTDGGLTWTVSNDFSPLGIRQLELHETDSTRIFAAGQDGCYLSTDAGATFALVSSGGLPTGEPASDVRVAPNDPNRVYCAFYDSGVWRTTDGGSTWEQLSGGLPTFGTGRIALAISKSNPQVILAGLSQNSGDLFKSTDGGDGWTRMNGGVPLGYCGGQCVYDNVVGIDANDETVMYAGGIQSWRSIDGGDTWDTMPTGGGIGIHVDQHAIFTPRAGEVFLANDGGIYYSSNQGSTFTFWADGMDTSQYYGICRHPTDVDWAMGGTQDNGTHRRLNGSWQQVLGGDGGMCMTGPAGTDIVIGEFQNHAMRRSTNGGNSWSSAEDGIGGGEPRPWVGVLAVDPSNRNHMWTSTNDVYRSTDAKATAWMRVGDDLRCDPAAGCLAASSISIPDDDSNTVWVGFRAQGPLPPFTDGTPGGVVRTHDALAASPTWTDVTGPDFPLRSVRQVRVHPDVSTTAYVVFAGRGAGKIRKTVDDGVTWVDVTGDHPDIPINDLFIDPDNPGTLLSATDVGIYRSDDDGTTWYGFSNGLPLAPAMDFTYDRASGKLRVGTHGRSMWDFAPDSAASAVSIPDGSIVAGEPMRASRLSDTDVRVTWDVSACNGADTNLFYGDLRDVATLTYSGEVCDLGTTGTADVTLPSGGSLFFVVASDDGAGTEGPHGYDSTGAVRGSTGIGACAVTTQDVGAGCP